jgi:malate-CoA ligase subunit beta
VLFRSLSGTNVELGRQILADSDIDLITADTLAEAAEKAVSAAQFHRSANAEA